MAPIARGRWTAVLVASAVAGALEALHNVVHGEHPDGPSVALVTLAVLSELGALTLTFEIGLRRRMASGWMFALTAAVAMITGLTVAFAAWGIQASLGVPILDPAHHWTPGIALRFGLPNGVAGLGFWAIAVVFPFALRDANARALEAERLRNAAELARLRAHLQPHFLLNTLNTVAGLVTEDPREARKLVGALGDLLRDSLAESDEMQTIEDEVNWLQRYAGILETRHRGILTFHWDIDAGTRHVRVPRLLLQPLLENAVNHGALRRRNGGAVAVRTTIDPHDGGRMTCVVEDNGPGPARRPTRPGALGIQLVTRRLALKYAGAAAFRLESGEGLTRSIVEIPMEAAT